MNICSTIYICSKNYSADTGEEEKINFHPGIKLWPRDWESSTLKHQAIIQDKRSSSHSLLSTTSGHWLTCQPHTGRPPIILCRQNPFRGQLEHLSIRGGAKMGVFTVQMPRIEVYLSILSFFTCISRVILTIPSPGELIKTS